MGFWSALWKEAGRREFSCEWYDDGQGNNGERINFFGIYCEYHNRAKLPSPRKGNKKMIENKHSKAIQAEVMKEINFK